MEDWKRFTPDQKLDILAQMVSSLSAQLHATVQASNNPVGSCIAVSSGDITSNVVLFRMDDSGINVFDIGLLAKTRGIAPNIVIGIRHITSPVEMVVIRGIIVDGDGIGYAFPVHKQGERMVVKGGPFMLPAGEDVGDVEKDLIIPFLKGRFSEESPPVQESHASRKTRTLFKDKPGRFWMEVNK